MLVSSSSMGSMASNISMMNSHGNMSWLENGRTGSVGQTQNTPGDLAGFIDTPPDPPNPLGDDTLLNDYIEWRLRDGRDGWFMAGFRAGMDASTEQAQRMLELANEKVEAARKEMAAAKSHMVEARQQMAEANQRMEAADEDQGEYESDESDDHHEDEDEDEDEESNDENADDEDDDREANVDGERADDNDGEEEQEEDDGDDDSQYTVSETFELLPRSHRQPTTAGKTGSKYYTRPETGRKKPVTHAEQNDDDDGEEEVEEEEDDDEDDDPEYTVSETTKLRPQSHRQATTAGKTGSKSYAHSKTGRKKPMTTGNRPTTARQLISVTAQTTTSSNQSAGSSQRRDRQIPWTDGERRLVGQYMKEIVAANIVKGEAKFAEIANRITDTTGIHRTWNSVKNYWNRDGRKAHGFDERIHRRVPFLQTGVRDKSKRERIPDIEQYDKKRGKVVVKEEVEEEDGIAEEADDRREQGQQAGKEDAGETAEGEVEEEEWEGWSPDEESGKESDEKHERPENEHFGEYGHWEETETGVEGHEEHGNENEDDSKEQYEDGNEDKDEYEDQNDDNDGDDNDEDEDDDYYKPQSSRRLDNLDELTSPPQSPFRSPSVHLRKDFTAQKRKRSEEDDDDYFRQPSTKVQRS